MIPLLLFFASLFTPAGPRPISVVPRETKLRLLEVINADRKREAGLAPVEFSDALSNIADEHCREMVREGYTSHWDLAGWKPYLRYAPSGIGAYTAENVSGIWETNFSPEPQNIWGSMLHAHAAFLTEAPPNDGHRRSILDPHNMLVGIGAAYNGAGLRMIEVYAVRAAALDPLPVRAALNANLTVRGHVVVPDLSLMMLSIYYEPLPRPMTVSDLQGTSAYSLPDEEYRERPLLGPSRRYVDGTKGSVEIDAKGVFSVPLHFWKSRPGVYTVAVWVRHGGDHAFIGALAPILVEEH